MGSSLNELTKRAKTCLIKQSKSLEHASGYSYQLLEIRVN
jgi:hypothetical protein